MSNLLISPLAHARIHTKKSPVHFKEKLPARDPFHFMGCTELYALLGKRAMDLQQLVELLSEVPASSIYAHMHTFFLRQESVLLEYTNDFAVWAGNLLKDRALAEKLSMVDPYQSSDLEQLRDHLIAVLENYLASRSGHLRAAEGQAFHFMSSQLLEVPANVTANNLEEFRNHLSTVASGSVYYHAYEARRRGAGSGGDFANWIENSIFARDLAAKIRMVNPFGYSLEQYRHILLDLCDQALAARQAAR